MARQRHGRIVFITSISSYAASVNRGEYCIAKAGLSMSAALYAQRLAPHGVLVYEIRPGIIRTDMTAPGVKDYEERIERGLVPQKRMGEPADVARVVRLSRTDFSITPPGRFSISTGDFTCGRSELPKRLRRSDFHDHR